MTIATFDLLVNNTDRKSGHCLLGLDGRIYAIDHGLCFAVDPKLRTVIWEFGGESIPDDLVEDVARVAREVPPGMRALLDADEIDAVRKRAKADRRETGVPGRYLRSSVPVADGVIERLVEEGDLDELVRRSNGSVMSGSGVA